MRGALLALLTIAGCAKGGDAPDAGPKKDAAPDVPTVVSAVCPTGQLAIDVSGTKQLTCVPLDGFTRTALADHCSVYLGWRDSCDACTTPPAKWGRVETNSCSPGTGVNNTCTMPTLGGTQVHMFGLDLDGDMDGNDKLYTGLHCTSEDDTGAIAPCPGGQLVNGFNGTAWTCASYTAAVVSYVHASCSIYLGWQDGCDGCTNPPAKWGMTSNDTCMNGVGTDNTCIAPTSLGLEQVRMFGLNTDGDVDGNDKFHVGMRCEPPGPGSSIEQTMCPVGQFVAETLTQGGFRCESPAATVAQYFANHCTLYFGWHDSCDGCTTPPTKWGTVRIGACMNGAGADDTCSKFTLGGASVDMFGLSTDGNVDENDVMYVGFRCD